MVPSTGATVSQFPGLTADAWNESAVPVDRSISVWLAVVAVWNWRDAGSAVNDGCAAPTVSVTPITTAFPPPCGLTVTDPLYVPGASPPLVTDRESFAGVELNIGVAISHAGFDEAFTEDEIGAPVEVTFTSCAGGGGDVGLAVKLTVAGATTSTGPPPEGPVTVNVTWTDRVLAAGPAAVMSTVPRYTPGARPAGFTETTTVAGVRPVSGEADSQFPPDALTDTVNEIAAIPPLRLRFFGAGGSLPWANVKLRLVGDTGIGAEEPSITVIACGPCAGQT